MPAIYGRQTTGNGGAVSTDPATPGILSGPVRLRWLIVVIAVMAVLTAGVYVNDAESGLIADIEEWLEKLAPFRRDYRHHHTGESNGDAHLKNLLIGHEVVVPVTNGRLDFGPWQQVYYAEFDGQRRKRVLIKVIGE